MREFIYYSKNAVTAGNKIGEDLMKAGRIDIACQIVIQAFFVSHHMRPDVKLHLIFDGPPDAPKHLEMFPGNVGLGDIQNKIDISKKDIAGLIKRMLYKGKKGKKIEVGAGFWVEKKSFSDLISEMVEDGEKVFILDKRGKDIRGVKIPENSVFVLGVQDGIPKQELKKIKHLSVEKISVGPYMLFASQSLCLLQNELDRCGVGS